MAAWQRLAWDTDFFGFPIARIEHANASEAELRAIGGELRAAGITVAYWPAAERRDELLDQRLGGELVLAEEKLTLLAAARAASTWEGEAPAEPQPSLLLKTEPFRDGMSLADLEQLGIDSGLYSRFVIDTRFPLDKAHQMLRLWMQRSVTKQLADEVLVIRQGERVAGMVTLGVKAGRGSIHLLAVGEEFRGRRLGEALIRGALDWTAQQGLAECQVHTQNANQAARRFYEKCGFSLDQIEYIYHWWL